MRPDDVDFLARLQQGSFTRASGATRAAYPPEQRMDATSLSAYLSRRRYLVVTTVTRTGRPDAAVSAFVFADGRFWLPTMEGTARSQNLRRSPYAALVVAEGDGTRHRAVLAEGPAEVVDRPTEAAVQEWERREGGLPSWAGSWIVVRPRKLFSFDGGAPETLMGWRCDHCGDAFTAHPDAPIVCPSCGRSRATVASEPFL